MAVFAMLGGVFGARLARTLPSSWVRMFVIITGLVMSAAFFLRA